MSKKAVAIGCGYPQCEICHGEPHYMETLEPYEDLQPARINCSDSSIPSDAKARKEFPIGTGVVDYFPDALAEIAHVSFVGNEQHNPGTPLHWDRSKSTDEADALMRHFVERGKRDSDGLRHSDKLAWRALALLQKEIEADRRANEQGTN